MAGLRVRLAAALTLPRIGRLKTFGGTTAQLQGVTAGTARILSATIACEAGRWYVAFGSEVDRAVVASNGHDDPVGVDLGVLTLATMSNGEVVADLRRDHLHQLTTNLAKSHGRIVIEDLNAAINLAGWAHPDVAPTAGERGSACPRGGQTGLSPARPAEAGTGIAPEPAGVTGGRRQPDVPFVPC
jgi:transposase